MNPGTPAPSPPQQEREIINTTVTYTAEARLGADSMVQQHLHRHTASLFNQHGNFGPPIPDTDAIESALRAIHQILVHQTPSSLDRIVYNRGLPASYTILWQGVQVSELLDVRHAG